MLCGFADLIIITNAVLVGSGTLMESVSYLFVPARAPADPEERARPPRETAHANLGGRERAAAVIQIPAVARTVAGLVEHASVPIPVAVMPVGMGMVRGASMMSTNAVATMIAPKSARIRLALTHAAAMPVTVRMANPAQISTSVARAHTTVLTTAKTQHPASLAHVMLASGQPTEE
uniref:G-protein coupled receptors family 1 profile domain-containing protein n=1 Tax=Ciona savignyi TaxID=51511 RepID=H2YXY3_CIOSA